VLLEPLGCGQYPDDVNLFHKTLIGAALVGASFVKAESKPSGPTNASDSTKAKTETLTTSRAVVISGETVPSDTYVWRATTKGVDVGTLSPKARDGMVLTPAGWVAPQHFSFAQAGFGAESAGVTFHINGICTSPKQMEDQLDLFAQAGHPCVGVYNATANGFLDVSQVINDKLDLGVDKCVTSTRQLLMRALTETKGDVNVSCYSAGGAQLGRALRQVQDALVHQETKTLIESGMSRPSARALAEQHTEQTLGRIHIIAFAIPQAHFVKGPHVLSFQAVHDKVPGLFGESQSSALKNNRDRLVRFTPSDVVVDGLHGQSQHPHAFVNYVIALRLYQAGQLHAVDGAGSP
jgi:hypothetical protein